MRTLPTALLALTIMAVPASAFAQAQVRQAPPGSPRMLVATAFSSAIEDGSTAALETLVTEHFAPDMRDGFTMDEHLEQLGQLSVLAGAAADIGFSPRAEFTVEIHLVASEGSRTVIVVDFEGAEPHLITGVDVEER